MEGNYNSAIRRIGWRVIIPLREMEGNYNCTVLIALLPSDYTLERDGRELQPLIPNECRHFNYTLERDGRELQHVLFNQALHKYYTLERDGRELQLYCSNCITTV